MQVLLNCHSAAFCTVHLNSKKAAKQQFNNTCMCNYSSLFLHMSNEENIYIHYNIC